MIPPTSIDGTDITGATIDGTDVQEITVDGDVVFTAAQPSFGTVIDNFESGNLNNYITGSDSPQIVTSPVAEGGFAFEHEGPSSPRYSAKSNTGLNAYPTQGRRFSNLLRVNSGSWGIGMAFGMPGGNNEGPFGAVTIAPSINEAAFFGVDSSGSTTFDDRKNVSVNGNQWYDAVVEWHDGSGSEPNNTIVWSLHEVDTSIDLTVNQGHTNTVTSGSVTFSDISGNTSFGFVDFTSSINLGYVDRILDLGPVS